MSQRAMYTAVSGIQNQQTQMDVIANNVANSGTIGYKKGRVTYKESFASLLQGASKPPGDQGGVNPIQIGNGSAIGSIDSIVTQGTIESTGNQTDIAINGDGFFVVNDGQINYYTRAGSFQWDSNGLMVSSSSGMKVQGKLADSTGVVSNGSSISDITVPFGAVDNAKSTSNVTFVGNLDSSKEPVGNILQTDALFSKEKAGEATNMNGLYAKGSADQKVTGLSSMSTTITVTSSAGSDGSSKTETYTYVESDSGSSSKDFHTIDDLIAEINNDFGTTHMTSSLNSSGAISFVNLGGVNNNLTLSSVNSVLNLALASANGTVGDRTTDEFSHVAVSTDKIIDLRNSLGEDLGLNLTDTIKISGRVGGTEIDSIPGGSANPYEINVDDGSGASIALGDFTQFVETSFSISTGSVQIDSATGAVVMTADGGLTNEITSVNITTDAAAPVFDSVFDSTVGNWRTSQNSEDVTHAASVEVYDSLGNTHTCTIVFTKDAKLPNNWTWAISVPEPAELSGGYEGTITFGSSGSLESYSYSQGASSFTFDPKNGADVPLEIVLDFGTTGKTNGVTQYSSNSTVIAKDQDGYSSGTLEDVSIDEYGKVTGQFSNGNSRTMAQLILATFNNPAGLLRTGDNLYAVSGNSGLPIYGFAGTSIDAEITPGAVEQSNVDIAEEFTNMIIAQRAFQANARTITTTDQLMEETVNLKR